MNNYDLSSSGMRELQKAASIDESGNRWVLVK